MIRILRPIPVEDIKLLVFDLDGTLIDSAKDLCNSVNAALLHCELPMLPDKQIASYIGDGALMLMRRALAAESDAPVDEAFLAKAYEFFLDYYREHKLDFTYAYPGVMESLRAVSTRPDGHRRTMAVLTNKPVRPARAICEALGLSPFFMVIHGGNSFVTKKPDPAGIHAVMEEAGARPQETVMIGDSEVDVHTARHAGAWSIGCTFGLSPQTLAAAAPDVLVDEPADWTAVLTAARIDSRL